MRLSFFRTGSYAGFLLPPFFSSPSFSSSILYISICFTFLVSFSNTHVHTQGYFSVIRYLFAPDSFTTRIHHKLQPKDCLCIQRKWDITTQQSHSILDWAQHLNMPFSHPSKQYQYYSLNCEASYSLLLVCLFSDFTYIFFTFTHIWAATQYFHGVHIIFNRFCHALAKDLFFYISFFSLTNLEWSEKVSLFVRWSKFWFNFI